MSSSHLVPRSIFSDFFSDPSDILFRDFFDRDKLFTSVVDVKSTYPFDIKQVAENLEIDIAVVGLDKKDISIEVKEGNILVVSYTKNVKEDEKVEYITRNITRKSFNLAWKISPKFDLNNLNASMEKGLLMLTIPPLPEKAPKLIQIKD